MRRDAKISLTRMRSLFSTKASSRIWIGNDILHLPEFFSSRELLPRLQAIFDRAPLRKMITPGGKSMSAQMTNAGDFGWVSSKTGYRYETVDPLSGKQWPDIPKEITVIAREASKFYGHSNYHPDCCLINLYKPDAQMSAHQDCDEEDFEQPVVSLSLGASATFKIGGKERGENMENIVLNDGDVLVFGRSKRLAYHSVGRPRKNSNAMLGGDRICCTCRVAR